MTLQHKEDYEKFMRECIRLAKMAKDRGDSPVGSVLVQNGQMISEGIEGGRTRNDITCHAEIEAIRNAIASGRTDLSEYTMITTHEPCIMCSYVIRHHKIKKIIIGLTVPDVGGYSSAFPILKDTSIRKWIPAPIIITGILEEECRHLNYDN